MIMFTSGITSHFGVAVIFSGEMLRKFPKKNNSAMMRGVPNIIQIINKTFLRTIS